MMQGAFDVVAYHDSRHGQPRIPQIEGIISLMVPNLRPWQLQLWCILKVSCLGKAVHLIHGKGWQVISIIFFVPLLIPSAFYESGLRAEPFWAALTLTLLVLLSCHVLFACPSCDGASACLLVAYMRQ